MANSADQWRGRELSCRNHLLLFDKAREQGIDASVLMQGLPYDLPHLLNKHERIDWDSSCQLLRNARTVWSSEELEAIGREIPASPFLKPFLVMAGALYSPADVYNWMFGANSNVGRQLLTCVDSSVHRVSLDELRIEYTTHDGFAVCPEMFEVMKGSLSMVPGMIGYPPADVMLTHTERGASFDIRLANHQPALHWVRRLFGSFGRNQAAYDELSEAHELLHQRYAELQRQMNERERTEQALLEKEAMLSQAQKLEAVGRMAGGIAHDFNNLLSVVLGYASLLKDTPDVADNTSEIADLIEDAADRGARLTSQLLAFSRGQPRRVETIDVNAAILATAELLDRTLGDEIEISYELTDGVGPISADRGQFEQVLMNIAINARDAMVDGGMLTLRTKNLAGADGKRQMTRIEIQDSGRGIPAEDHARIFDPFFTTKPDGNGLGLSTVYGIITQSHGSIGIESAPDAGTTFLIDLPVTSQKSEAPELVLSESAVSGHEAVLVVEDNDELRSLLRWIYAGSGYDVVTASNGSEAMIQLDKLNAIDLLVTDVRMPGMGGRELAHRFRQKYPDTPVLFISGDTGGPSDDLAIPHSAMLPKPFRPDALLRESDRLIQAAKS
jgi:signal transduction histidine kinase/CheY-like chemotaxis protein